MISRLFVINFLITVIRAEIAKESLFYFPYEDARNSIIEAEHRLTTGGRLHLNNRESRANNIFLKYKYDDFRAGFQNPDNNAAGMHFFNAKPLIERSKVFKFLQKMPKGANLHVHTTAAVSSEWVVRNIFYIPGLLRCINNEGLNIFTFRQQPEQHGCATQYMRISDERRNAASSRDYDISLESSINLYTPRPEFEYNSIKKVWTKFQNMFNTISDALFYLPAYRSFHWQMLEELFNDNIMYAEVRLNFNELYDINGRTYPAEQTVAELIAIVERFKRERPYFLGIKMIYSVHRNTDSNVIRQNFEKFKRLHSLYPNYIIGFDLVGQEDLGRPLYSLVNALNDKPPTSKFFFHAGETNWYGATTDYNLVDAMLLNTTRIGHGYALMKHPMLWQAVKDRNIAVEVSPISNQVLHLVWDLRNHPGSFFISQNIPIVICNDDPGFWNAKGLSYDFYYAIMSLAPNNAGLKTLKQLVLNSINYSILNPKEYRRAHAVFQSQWERFIDDVLRGSVV